MISAVAWFKPHDFIWGCIEINSTDNAFPLLVWALSVTKREGTCSVLMLHSSWNNPTVFQTPKWTPKLDTLPPTSPTHPLSPAVTVQPTNQPTHHPLLPYTHPLVSCPYLGERRSERLVEEGSRRRRAEREGFGLTQGRQEEKQWTLASSFLIRTCLEFRPLTVKSVSFVAPLLSTKVKVWSVCSVENC